jgi:hypothetical protein
LDGDNVLDLPGTQRFRTIDYVVSDLFLASLLAGRKAHDVTRHQEARTVFLGRLNFCFLDDQFPDGRIRGLNNLRDWTRLAGPPIHLIMSPDRNRRTLFDREAARFGFCLASRRYTFDSRRPWLSAVRPVVHASSQFYEGHESLVRCG